MYSTISRLFYGLSDIAKAVGIILVADTLLGERGVGECWGEVWHGGGL
jgi:hypothetical protein